MAVTALEPLLERTLAGLGLQLADFEYINKGSMLRVFIEKEHEMNAEAIGGGITIADCEAASRQLQRVLEVEGVRYDRLEVSSPGLDRPLCKPADFMRFAGSKVDVKMRTRDESGRKRFTGLLRGEAGGVATLEVEGRDVALRLDEMDRARLVPDLPAKAGPAMKGKK